MPAGPSAASRACRWYCGWLREPGNRRTSATTSIRYDARRPRKSGSGRVECPTVHRIRATRGHPSVRLVQLSAGPGFRKAEDQHGIAERIAELEVPAARNGDELFPVLLEAHRRGV